MKSPEKLLLETVKINEKIEPLLYDMLAQYSLSEYFLNRSPNAQSAYLNDLTRFQNYCQENNILKLSQLSPDNISDWISQESKYKSTATTTRRITGLKSFINWAIAEKLLQPELSDEIEKLPRFHIRRSWSKILNHEQTKSLIDLSLQTKNIRDAALVQIALKTGAKATEILSLRASDILSGIDDSKITIRLHNYKKKERKIPLDEEGSRIVKRYLNHKNLDQRSNKPLFTKQYKPDGNEYLTREGFRIILNDFGKEIGVPDLNPTILRNTFTANLMGNDQERAEILGVVTRKVKKLLETKRK